MSKALKNITKLKDVVDVVADFGAAGDGLTLGDTAKINAAILSVSVSGGGKVIIPAGFTFLLELSNQSGLSYATRQNAIIGQSNVVLQVDGTLKLKTGTNIGSTLGSLISAPDVGVSNFKVTGTGVVDGNSSSVTATQTLNIYIPSVDNVSVQGIRSINASYVGIQLIPPLPYVSGTCITNCSVLGTVVKASGNIGIQVSHSTHNCVIGYNLVDTCGNNCIDVYASNSSAIADAGVVTIVGNAVYAGLTGVFVETSANVTTTGNSIYGCTTGIASNRVNGAPRNDVYTGNTIGACATAASFTGDTGGILFTGNTLDAFTLVGVQLGGVANVSYAVITNNTFNPYSTTTNCITITGATASFNVIRQNYLLDTAHNPANLIVNTASTSVFNTIEPLMNVVDVQPVKKMFSGTSASGGTSTITVPVSSAGKLVIKSSAGGAWNSVWSGSFTSDATQVKVAQESSTFTTPGNNVTNVTVTGASLVITITWAASGSAGNWYAWAEYF